MSERERERETGRGTERETSLSLLQMTSPWSSAVSSATCSPQSIYPLSLCFYTEFTLLLTCSPQCVRRKSKSW